MFVRIRFRLTPSPWPARVVGILEDHYAWCDVLVVPSLWDENEPLVIKEARWCGIPVAVHDLPGLGNWFREGVDGWILPEKGMMPLALAPTKDCKSIGLGRAPSSTGPEVMVPDELVISAE